MGDAIFLRRAKKLVKDISVAVVTLASGTLTYNGSVQTKQVASVILDGKTLTEGVDYTVSGNTGTNAGSYTLTITGIGDYEGTINTAWSIAKAAGRISVSPTSLSVTGKAGTTKTATISYTGDGSISVASSNSGIATVSRSGNTITVTSVASGSATITITLGEGSNYTGASCTIAVTAVIVGTLEATSWDMIKSLASTGANYWSVGDRKSVVINGTVGIYTFSNETYYCYILGFNHNPSIEGNGIHFQFGFTAASGGVHVAFCDSMYDSSITSGDMFHMTTSDVNNGGWGSSYMRGTICSQFLSALPSSLKNVIASTTKYTDNTGGTSSSGRYVTSTSDKIFLLAEYEVHGARTYAHSSEQNYQKQYDYYRNGNSKVMYQSTSTSSATFWWTRSPYYSINTARNFCSVSRTGAAGSGATDLSSGFAPGFKVAA